MAPACRNEQHEPDRWIEDIARDHDVRSLQLRSKYQVPPSSQVVVASA